MRLLFAIKTMDSRGGGAERILAQITAELADRGHDVTLLSFDAQDSPDFYAVDERVRRVWLNAGRRLAPTSALDFLKRVRALRRSVLQIRPDVAIGFMHSAFVPLAFALVGTRIPVVGSEHGVHDHFATRPIERFALLAGAGLYDRITVVSEQSKAGFPTVLARRMVVIPNPVAVERGQACETSRMGRKTILNVGRLSDEKDQRTLISAFAQIAARHAEWNLRIVGEGGLREQLVKQASELGVADRVELPGATRSICDEYAAADIFAVSSTYESFGLATAEALSAGLPAIGFADCPGTNLLIRDGVNGLLVDTKDRVCGMAAALDRLIRFPEERARMAAAAPASADILSVGRVADRWEELFSAIVQSRPKSRSDRSDTAARTGRYSNS